MNLFEIPFFNLVRQQMKWLESRQDTIAENIANADTPDYGAQDLQGLNFEKLLKGEGTGGTGMKATNSHHLSGTVSGADGFKNIAAPDRESSPNGNSVMLEDQMMKMGETQMDHEAAVGLYRKAIDLLRIAVRGG